MIAATLSAACQIFDAAYAKALDPLGVTARQLVILRAIRDHGGEPSQTALVIASGMDRSTTADVIRRMLKAGLIARKRTKNDQRAYAVSLTAEGARVLKEGLKAAAKIDAAMTKRYPIGGAILTLGQFADAHAESAANAASKPAKAAKPERVPA